MTVRYTGSWATAARARRSGPESLQPGPDARHSTPDNDPNVIDYTETGDPAPGLPVALVGSAWRDTTTAPGSPVETPRPHDVGVGIGPGLTSQEALEARARRASDTSDKALADLTIVPHSKTGVDEGTTRDAEGSDVQADSPPTLELDRAGRGGVHDPYARRPVAVRRTATGVYDRLTWDTDFRPLGSRVIDHNRRAGTDGGSSQITPDPTSTAYRGSPDTSVEGVDRIVPEMPLGTVVASSATGVWTIGGGV